MMIININPRTCLPSFITFSGAFVTFHGPLNRLGVSDYIIHLLPLHPLSALRRRRNYENSIPHVVEQPKIVTVYLLSFVHLQRVPCGIWLPWVFRGGSLSMAVLHLLLSRYIWRRQKEIPDWIMNRWQLCSIYSRWKGIITGNGRSGGRVSVACLSVCLPTLQLHVQSSVQLPPVCDLWTELTWTEIKKPHLYSLRLPRGVGVR